MEKNTIGRFTKPIIRGVATGGGGGQARLSPLCPILPPPDESPKTDKHSFDRQEEFEWGG